MNTRIVMEHTSMYWKPIALTLKKAGFFVFVVNAMLIHDFRDNTNIEEIRRLMAQSTTGGQFTRFRKFTYRNDQKEWSSSFPVHRPTWLQ